MPPRDPTGRRVAGIPPLLHFVWLSEGPGDEPRAFHLACRQRALDLHDGWRAVAWSDAGVLAHPALAPLADDIGPAWAKFSGRPTARSDLFRLCALYVYGGIYLDYDVWLVKPLHDFLACNDELILGVNSYTPLAVGEHVIGATARSPKVAEVIRYLCRQPLNPDGKYSPHFARFVREQGWEAYPPEVFCPHSRDAAPEDLYRVTENTTAVHCWSPHGYDLSRLRSLSLT